jgi:hypothetical protein
MISEALYAPGSRHGTITVSAFHIALALSLLLHLAALWKWLPHLRLNLELPKLGDDIGTLVVHLAPPPQPPAAVAPELAIEPQPAIAPHAPPRVVVARPRAAPPVIALNKSTPAAPPPTAQPANVPLPPRPAPTGDLASYIEAQRRSHPQSADSAPAAPVVDEETLRRNRIIASNLTPRTPTFGYDPDKHGGIFQIRHVGYDSAEFTFFGWNRDARHNTMQEIEVRTRGNEDIRLAVVRKMIAIIRENTQEDFLWESSRLGRNVMLSARVQDNAGLEEFLMKEFFVNPRVPQ